MAQVHAVNIFYRNQDDEYLKYSVELDDEALAGLIVCADRLSEETSDRTHEDEELEVIIDRYANP